MTKIFIFLLIAVSLAVSSGLNSEVKLSQSSFLSAQPTATPTPEFSAKIEKVNLSKTEVIIPCPKPKFIPEGLLDDSVCYKDDRLVEIKTVVSNPKNQEISHFYTVSGGRIVGTGGSVVWDLSRVRPGNYTITVAIGDGREVSNVTHTREVRVGECSHCDEPCVCPTVDVTGGGRVKAGDTVTFTAKHYRVEDVDVTYRWSISSGEIIEGQGTPTIKVKTTDKMIGETVEATVELGGFPPACVCKPTNSATATVVDK